MYKTIRHGENSLQYTILPQNDDFRMDNGKLNSASNSRGSHKIKRGKKKSFFAYLGLLFVCTVIIGAILIPFLVSAECLPNPSDWFIKTKNVFSNNSKNNINQKNLNNSNTINITGISSTTEQIKTVITQNNSVTSNKTKSTIKSYPDSYYSSNMNNNYKIKEIPTTVINNFNKNNNKIQYSSNNNEIVKTADSIYNLTSNVDLKHNKIEDSSSLELIDVNESLIKPETNIPEMNRIVGKSNLEKSVTTNVPKFLITTSNAKENSVNSVETKLLTATTTTTASPPLQPTVQNYAVIGLTKKPIILPVLAKTNSIIKENGKVLSNDRNEPKNWIKSHWPFIDPSTYFQWTGYKSEDSVLLPAILGVALIGIILLVSICLVVRNKKSFISTVRKRNRNDIEESGEDNATLLATSNLSDDD